MICLVFKLQKSQIPLQLLYIARKGKLFVIFSVIITVTVTVTVMLIYNSLI